MMDSNVNRQHDWDKYMDLIDSIQGCWWYLLLGKEWVRSPSASIFSMPKIHSRHVSRSILSKGQCDHILTTGCVACPYAVQCLRYLWRRRYRNHFHGYQYCPGLDCDCRCQEYLRQSCTILVSYATLDWDPVCTNPRWLSAVMLYFPETLLVGS